MANTHRPAAAAGKPNDVPEFLARSESDKKLVQLQAALSCALDAGLETKHGGNLIWLASDLADELVEMRENGHG